MRHFFLSEAPARLEGSWEPSVELGRHLRALRLEPDEEFLLMLPLGGAVRARWDGRGVLELAGLTEMPRLALLPVTLATAWPKGPRADELVVRATEFGVERIVPLHCERSIAGRDALPANRMLRWQKLAREACQQSGRTLPPTIDSQPIAPAQALEEAPLARPVVLQPGAWPLGMELSLHTPDELLLLVGPDGGWSPAELDTFEARRVARAGLIPPILRIESAGPLGVAVAQHWFLQTRSR